MAAAWYGPRRRPAAARRGSKGGETPDARQIERGHAPADGGLGAVGGRMTRSPRAEPHRFDPHPEAPQLIKKITILY